MKRRALIQSLAVVAALVASVPAAARDRWIASWGNALIDDGADRTDLDGAVVRTYVRLSAGGAKVRIRISNAFGTAPLKIDSANVAVGAAPGKDQIDPASLRRLRFSGSDVAVIPQGAEYYSDPVDLGASGLQTVAVTYRIVQGPVRASTIGWPANMAFISRSATGSEPVLPGAAPTGKLLQLAGVDVVAGEGARTIAVLGDSITAAGGASATGRGRWTDVLATRLQGISAGRQVGIVNLGISGGRMAKEGSGPAALARLERDVMSRPGLDTIVTLIGVNDLGRLSREGPVTPESRAEVVRQVIAGYQQLVTRAHDRGIRVVALTILPFGQTGTYRSDADAEADRQKVNAWLRAPGHVDAVFELDKVMADPSNPALLSAAYDRGDHLHPSAAGQDAMGNAIPLNLLLGPARPRR